MRYSINVFLKLFFVKTICLKLFLYISYVIIKKMCTPSYHNKCNSCTWECDVRLLIAGTNGPKSVQQTKQGE